MVVTTFKCCKNRLNQTASYTATEHVIYYASIVDGAIQDSFLLFLVIAPLLSKNACHVMDLCSSRSLPQSASL
jgi:hypothetical protein